MRWPRFCFRIGWLVLLAVLAMGCAVSSHPFAILPDHAGTGKGARLMLLPLNVVVSLPAELEKPSQNVTNEMTQYLEESGNSLETLGFYEARSRWLAAVKQVQAAGGTDQDFNAAARVFVEGLARDDAIDAIDAIILPSLVYRTAELYGGVSSASWDGVQRDVDVVNQAQLKGSIHLMGGFYGSMEGVSLHLYAFDAAGERFFESYGGLDLVHQYDMSGTESTYHYQLHLKSDPLADAQALREGIELAFEPYIPLSTQARANDR